LLAQPPFTVSGRDVLLIEPGNRGSSPRLTSRTVATGEINWTTEDAFYHGPPIVCGSTVYADTARGMRSFDLQTGTEKTTTPASKRN
jgi:hypothetical protein